MPTDRTRLLISSVLDPGTGAASSTTAGLPYINVKDQLIRKVYRTTGKASEWVRLRASGGATSINMVFIGNHNFTKNASLWWQGNSTSNFASGPALSTALTVVTDALGNVIPKVCLFYDAVKRYPHWRLLFKDSGNATSNLQIGRIMAGRYIQPTQNMSEGFTIRTIDPSRGMQTAGRQAYWNTKTAYQEYTYRVSWANKQQQDELVSVYRSVGMHNALVLAVNPTSRPTHDTIYCQFTQPISLQSKVLDTFDVQEVVFQEKN